MLSRPRAPLSVALGRYLSQRGSTNFLSLFHRSIPGGFLFFPQNHISVYSGAGDAYLAGFSTVVDIVTFGLVVSYLQRMSYLPLTQFDLVFPLLPKLRESLFSHLAYGRGATDSWPCGYKLLVVLSFGCIVRLLAS